MYTVHQPSSICNIFRPGAQSRRGQGRQLPQAAAVHLAAAEPGGQRGGGHQPAAGGPGEPWLAADSLCWAVIGQEWYHGVISRHQAEAALKPHSEGSYLLRATLDTGHSIALK